MSASVLDRRPALRDYEIFKETEASTKKILEQKIEWKTYADSKLLTAEEVGVLRDFDKQSKEVQTDFIDEQGVTLARVFAKCITNIQVADTVQYILAIVSNMLQEDESRARLFHQIETDDGYPYSPFMKILTRNVDPAFAVAKASHILSILLSTHSNPESMIVSEYLSWLSSRLESSKGADLLHVVNSLKQMLKKSRGAQRVFVKEGGLKNLCLLLSKETTNTQLLYLAVFCFLTLSFNPEVKETLLEYDVVAKLVDLLKSGPREKVIRVIFTTLRNLLDVPAFSERMLTSGLMKILPALQNRKLADDDLTEDIKIVDETLEKYIALLSSYEKYQTEVQSDTLEWTPVHNEKFWRENIAKFDEDGCMLIRYIVDKLMDSDNNMTVEVACYDLGEFARFHANGRKILTEMGGKKKLMLKMKHPNAGVAKQALLAVQKLMVHNWETFNVMHRN